MDDGRLAREMTLETISKQLREIDTKVGHLDTKVGSLDAKLGELDTKMTAGFKKVDDRSKDVDRRFNEAKIRDEELHGQVKFSLEAREALRDTMMARFDTTDKKQDESIGLLKDVIRDLARTRRPPKRRRRP